MQNAVKEWPVARRNARYPWCFAAGVERGVAGRVNKDRFAASNRPRHNTSVDGAIKNLWSDTLGAGGLADACVLRGLWSQIQKKESGRSSHRTNVSRLRSSHRRLRRISADPVSRKRFFLAGISRVVWIRLQHAPPAGRVGTCPQSDETDERRRSTRASEIGELALASEPVRVEMSRSNRASYSG